MPKNKNINAFDDVSHTKFIIVVHLGNKGVIDAKIFIEKY